MIKGQGKFLGLLVLSLTALIFSVIYSVSTTLIIVSVLTVYYAGFRLALIQYDKDLKDYENKMLKRLEVRL